MSDQPGGKTRGKPGKIAIAIGVYLALWLLTGLAGGSQVRSNLQAWKKSGAHGVDGNLKIAMVSAWSPCPFLVIAEKHNVGVVLDLYNGSSSTTRIDRRWFIWLLFPVEL